MTINVWSDSMQHIELLGKPALFSDSRVDRSTVPDGWYVYDLRACPVVSGQIVPAERNLACISGCGNRHFARCTCDDGMASTQKYLITCFAKEEL